MEREYFKALEDKPEGYQIDFNDFIERLSFNEDGLIPCIAQQFDTKEVLMMAWMNKASLLETIETGQVCYWSRSRQSFWRKGESSGHRQTLVKMTADCDGDTLLAYVDQKGAACHTYRRDCFYFELASDSVKITSDPGKS